MDPFYLHFFFLILVSSDLAYILLLHHLDPLNPVKGKISDLSVLHNYTLHCGLLVGVNAKYINAFNGVCLFV